MIAYVEIENNTGKTEEFLKNTEFSANIASEAF